MESNVTILQRRPRHISFLDIRNSTRCFFAEKFESNITQMCNFVTNTLSCRYFTNSIDYLNVLFCQLEVPLNGLVIFASYLIMIVSYCVVYMLMKYFFLPNFRMLMERMPISSYSYGFVCFGILFFMPDYLSTWLTCLFNNSYEASLRLSCIFGDEMRYFVLGFCALCVNGYKVEGLLLWSNIIFLLLGYFYLLVVLRRKYEIFQKEDLVNPDLYMLKLRATSFLVVFILYLITIILVSYYKKRKKLKRSLQSIDQLEQMEIQNIESEWKLFQIWWRSVNGYNNMNEPVVGMVTILIPFYFLAANLIPVIDMKRHLNGWCKTIGLTSFLFLPFLCIPFKPWPSLWFMLLMGSWLIALVILCATRWNRAPNYLSFYAVFGMLMCTLVGHYLHQEINNMIWQYVNWLYNPPTDLLAQLFFNSSEVFSGIVVVVCLQRSNNLDAAFGVIMSMTTYTIYLALPLLVLHVCYTQNTLLVITATTESCIVFTIAMIVCSLFHISFCGNELRVSLFLYLLTLTMCFILFQWMTYYNWIHPFGTLHLIKSPREPNTTWA